MDYDIICVGGGLGGSALAKVMTEAGARVLVLERETQFRDRVRGEALMPWGVAEATALGLYELFRENCGHEVAWAAGLGPDRDLLATTPQAMPMLTFYHPAMQQAAIDAAARAGAEIRRNAKVGGIKPGAPAVVEFEVDGKSESARARMVVGADGRTSSVRKWGNFEVKRDDERLLFAGVLIEGVQGIKPNANYMLVNPAILQACFIAPQKDGRARTYLAYRTDSDFRLNGEAAMGRFIEETLKCGAPADYYSKAKAIGPLATFSGADVWVDHPYCESVALIGDAAATSDPAWGQGMSLTLRDVRALRDALIGNDDWDKAGNTYATEHDRYYRVVHTWEDWLTSFFYDRGQEADARRARAMPQLAEDPTRIPDYMLSGPELPIDDSVRRRFFAED